MELIVAALLAGGHVLLDDVPGVAKTLAARSIATAAGLSFSRIQFTPDVLPSDITGATVIDLSTGHPTFRRGPVFAELVLADEINRAPAKTQAALLEAMQESQVTIDGTTHPLPNPFFVIATENPVESEGTYPLPEAQLDRFIVRAHLGYPAFADEVEMVARRLARGTDEVVIRQVTNTAQLDAVRIAIEQVHVEPVLVAYVVDIINASRKHRELSLGASPRGSLAVIKVARAQSRAPGARLRHARRRPGDRTPGADPSGRAERRGVGAWHPCPRRDAGGGRFRRRAQLEIGPGGSDAEGRK